MLEINNISKTFNPGTVNAKLALEGLSLKVNDGDFITIIGANGAGKSTLFNAIAGSFYVDEGSIALDGEDITYVPEHIRARSIGRLFQDPMRGTAPGMSIEESLKQLDMGLEERLRQPMGLLSGGQRQAVTLLMATINPPKLLLLDEHTAALDPAAADKILEITKDTVKKENLTCMMITHNMQSALEIGNRTLMMDGGRIILDVSGEERRAMTVGDLLERFRDISGRALDNDRMILT